MKKLFCMLLTLVMVMAMVACGNPAEEIAEVILFSAADVNINIRSCKNDSASPFVYIPCAI